MTWLRSTSGFYHKWVLTAVVAFVIGDYIPLIGGASVSLGSLILLAVLQYLVIWQQYRQFPAWWILAAIISGLVFQSGIFVLIYYFLSRITVGIAPIIGLIFPWGMLGLLVGLGQWLVLRRQSTIRNAAWWVAANIIAFAVALPLGLYASFYVNPYLGASSVRNIWLLLSIAFLRSLIEGIAFGLISGFVITRILPLPMVETYSAAFEKAKPS